jgi:large subunit ribosomal protein L6
MSRIGLKPVKILSGVELKVAGNRMTVKGPKGELSIELLPCISVVQEGAEALVSVKNPDDKKERALWGTFRAHLQNMVRGVSEGFTKSLEVNGVGYRANVSGNTLVLEVGYSHDVNFQLPTSIKAVVDKNIITLSGIDKQIVGETAAQIRKVRPPEPYKGTGIKYTNETIRRKAGKAGKAGA